MTRHALPLATAAVLVALTLTACKRDRGAEDTAAAPPPGTTPAGTASPAPQTLPPATSAPAAAPTPAAQVVSLELGTSVDDNNKIAAAASSFKPGDTIYVSVATTTADPAASVPARLGARWSKDGQVIHEQHLDVTLSGTGQTAFKINKPSGFPAGRYRVEILLDGQPVQSREFEVAAQDAGATTGTG